MLFRPPKIGAKSAPMAIMLSYLVIAE